MFEDAVIHHFDAQLDGVGGRARAHRDPAVRRYVVPLAVRAFVLQWTVEVCCFGRIRACTQVQGDLDFAVHFALSGFGQRKGGVYVRSFGHVGRNRADRDRRCVCIAVIFDSTRCRVYANISAFRYADRCAKVFTDFIILVIHRYDSNRRHICRCSTQWDRNSDSCQGFSQAYSMRHTRSISISDTLNIIRLEFAQIQFEYNCTILCAYSSLVDMEDHAGGFDLDRDRRICRDIDEWLWRNVDV